MTGRESFCSGGMKDEMLRFAQHDKRGQRDRGGSVIEGGSEGR